MLPLTPEPVGTAVDAGALPARKVIVWPLTVNVSPSAGDDAKRVAAPAVPIRVAVPARFVAPSAAFTAAAATKVPAVAPSVLAAVAAVVPPAAPVYSTLLLAVALA